MSKMDAVVHFENLSYRLEQLAADQLKDDVIVIEVMKEIAIYLTMDHVTTMPEDMKKRLCEGLDRHRLNNDARNFFAFLRENHVCFELTPASILWKTLKILAEYLKFISKKNKTEARGRRL